LRKAKWISQRVWRTFHYTGYAAWVLMLGHGIFNGSDTRSPFALGAYAGAAAVVAGCAVWRWSSAEVSTVPARR
jgi:hypothetical protein